MNDSMKERKHDDRRMKEKADGRGADVTNEKSSRRGQ